MATFVGVRLVALHYDLSDLPKLRKMAQPVLPTGAKTSEGTSTSRQAEFFAGRATLAALFREVGYEGVVVPNPWFGFLTAHPDTGLFLNLSHTRGLAVAAVAHSPVGVDVEALARDASRALRKAATTEELEMIAGLKFQVEGKTVSPQVALWSAKEAVSKATGVGIKFGMQAFGIGLDRTPPYPVTLKLTGPLLVRDPAVTFRVHGGFLIAVCSNRDELSSGVAPPTILK